MIRSCWRSLGFYWQTYIFTAVSLGGIIMLVEGVVEPYILEPWYSEEDGNTGELIVWIACCVILPLALCLLPTRMTTRKITGMVDMAKRLAKGELSARMRTAGSERDVFNQMARVFNEMAEAIEGLLLHEKSLLADISHELRSPLARMGVASALLPMKTEPAEMRATAALLEGEIRWMSDIVGMLLTHARRRLEGREGHSRTPFSELLSNSVNVSALVAADRGLRIEARIEPGLVVSGRPVLLRMIIDNILDNALFYSPAGSAVSVRLERKGDSALLVIRDRGTGVPEKHLGDIFRAFFRVDASRARTSGGAGLGLALANDAAVSMGGTMTARNADPGLEMTVAFPLPTP